MLFNSYPPGVLVSPKLHPLGEAARISQFLASRVCQQQMFPAKGGYKTFVLFQSISRAFRVTLRSETPSISASSRLRVL